MSQTMTPTIPLAPAHQKNKNEDPTTLLESSRTRSRSRDAGELRLQAQIDRLRNTLARHEEALTVLRPLIQAQAEDSSCCPSGGGGSAMWKVDSVLDNMDEELDFVARTLERHGEELKVLRPLMERVVGRQVRFLERLRRAGNEDQGERREVGN